MERLNGVFDWGAVNMGGLIGVALALLIAGLILALVTRITNRLRRYQAEGESADEKK